MTKPLATALLVALLAAPACGGDDDDGDTDTDDTDTMSDSGPDTDEDGCLPDVAWYSANTPEGHAVEVGQKDPNAFGLYDVLGNAIEWTEDCYHESYSGAPTDGAAWSEDGCEYRVLRGGCYGSTPRALRVSWRDGVIGNFYGACLPGVRCARDLEPALDGGTEEVDGGVADDLAWVEIPAGGFRMGCSEGDEDCYDNEGPAREVTIEAFELMAMEATQQQYFDQTGLSPGDYYCPECAASKIAWDAAKAFCEAVGGRLPTEAEWEYAARAGTTTPYYCTEE